MQRPKKKDSSSALPPCRRFRRPFIYLNWLELSRWRGGPRQEAYLKTGGAIPGFHMALCKCLKGERETGFIAARAASLSFSAARGSNELDIFGLMAGEEWMGVLYPRKVLKNGEFRASNPAAINGHIFHRLRREFMEKEESGFH